MSSALVEELDHDRGALVLVDEYLKATTPAARLGQKPRSGASLIHMRVVRFTDVDATRVKKLVSEIDESAGPPEGINATSPPVPSSPRPA